MGRNARWMHTIPRASHIPLHRHRDASGATYRYHAISYPPRIEPDASGSMIDLSRDWIRGDTTSISHPPPASWIRIRRTQNAIVDPVVTNFICL